MISYLRLMKTKQPSETIFIGRSTDKSQPVHTQCSQVDSKTTTTIKKNIIMLLMRLRRM